MKILMPIDGSDSSQATLEWASTVLDRNDNEFYLLTVLSDPMIVEYQLEDAQEVLDDARDLLTRHGYRVVKSEYMTGDPQECICQAAEDENADQILMGSHGRSGLTRVLLGSVSEGVLKHCRRPVFIHRAQQTHPASHRLL